jgi:hypothetical protein
MSKKIKKRPTAKRLKIVTRKLGKHRAWGLYWQPWGNSIPLIELDARMKPAHEFDTLVHESLHHLFPEMEEEQVAEKATELSKILWGQNYRKVSQ